MSEQSASAKREYAYALLTGAVGAGLILLAVREQWAQALFTQPKPLPSQVINVSGNDLVPVASALALAALAGLAAVIATRGVFRRVAGVLLALFGAGAGVAVMSSVTAATVLSVAASKVASPESAAVSGTVGSTTSGSSGASAGGRPSSPCSASRNASPISTDSALSCCSVTRTRWPSHKRRNHTANTGNNKTKALASSTR